jgi:uncharacterized protein
MATTMEGAFTIPADKAFVWAKLNDPDVLKACISGCQAVEKRTDTDFYAIAKVKIGPLRASVRGRVELRDVDAPHGCRLVGEGEGGLAGFARGAADIRLTSTPDGTTVSYALEAAVGGRLSRLNGRLIDTMAKRLADGFFLNFMAVIAPRPTVA